MARYGGRSIGPRAAAAGIRYSTYGMGILVLYRSRTPCPPPGHTVLYEYSYRIAVWALLERHITRCPLGAVKYSMHRGLAYVVARLLRQAGAAKTDIVFEVSNLRAGDKTGPGDVVWLHVLRPGQHLLIDVSITGV